MAQYFIYNDQSIGSGDTVAVHQEIVEGKKKRIQVFQGIVIAIKNRGNGKSFTVRKIGANNVPVEKIYPVRLPSIKKLVVKKSAQVRRAKLYYLRDKVGKAATRIKEKNIYAKTKKKA